MFKGERMELSFNNTGFLLYLKGGIFEKDPLTKFLGDYRSEPLKENILFSLKVNDFKGIEKYHLLNNEIYRDATCSYFYTPIEEHRTYENSTLKEASEKGIFWKLDWFDFTGKILPKLKYEGSKYVVDLDSVNTSVNTIE
jgi:hypothetical protein